MIRSMAKFLVSQERSHLPGHQKPEGGFRPIDQLDLYSVGGGNITEEELLKFFREFASRRNVFRIYLAGEDIFDTFEKKV